MDYLANYVHRLLNVLFDEFSALRSEVFLDDIKMAEGKRERFHVLNTLDSERSAR